MDSLSSRRSHSTWFLTYVTAPTASSHSILWSCFWDACWQIATSDSNISCMVFSPVLSTSPKPEAVQLCLPVHNSAFLHRLVSRYRNECICRWSLHHTRHLRQYPFAHFERLPADALWIGHNFFSIHHRGPQYPVLCSRWPWRLWDFCLQDGLQRAPIWPVVYSD